MNRVFLNSSNVIEIHVVGDQTPHSVIEMCDQAKGLISALHDQKKPAYLLDNLKAMGETDSETRAAVTKYAKILPFDRAAMVGDGSLIMRLSTNLMLRAIGRSNIRYFSSTDSAMLWFGLSPIER